MTVELLAKIIHGATSAIDRIDGTTPANWEDLTEESKQLSYKNIRELFFNLKDAEQAHNLWMKTKMEAGWVFGEVFSVENKTHPSIVPFIELPISEIYKDEIWVALIEKFRMYLTL